MEKEDKIIVAIRKRPLTRKELNKKQEDIIDIKSETNLSLREKKQKVDLTKYTEEHLFHFDACYGEKVPNAQLYENLVQPLVALAFNKARITVFAYGQTGSGKTYTMIGDIKKRIPGIYLLAANDIFKILESPEFSELNIGVSFYEIYCDKAYDLLNQRNACPIRCDAKENVNIVGLCEKRIGNTDSLMSLINYGMDERMTGSTGMNDDSSRSHAILQITIRNSRNKIHGKMSFVDLAGSERGADVKDTNKQTRMDGAEINKSLLALKECIRSLDMGTRHVQFRQSKLTLVLKDSFIGKCKTVMIGNISPALCSSEHTLNTLRYADRVKELKGGNNNREKNSKDERARQLMLPRMQKNSRKITIKKKGSFDHIQFDEYEVNNEAQQPDNKNFFKRNSMAIEQPRSNFIKDPKRHSFHPSNGHKDKSNGNKTFLKDLTGSGKKVFGNRSMNIINNNRQSNAFAKKNTMMVEESPILPRLSESTLADVSKKQDALFDEHNDFIDEMVGHTKKGMDILRLDREHIDLTNYLEETKALLERQKKTLQQFENTVYNFEASLQNIEDKKAEYNDYSNDLLDFDGRESDLFGGGF